MHRLAIFQHNIVGNINDVIDGTHTVSAQTLTQPLGRRTDLHICNHTGRVAITQVGCFHFHIQLFVHRAGGAALNHRFVVFHRQTECSSGFTGKADDGVAVGTVIGDFEVNDGIVIANHQIDVIAGFAIFIVKNPDTVLVGAGQVILSQSQLNIRAEHTIGGDTAELALGDVNTTGQPGVVQCSRHQVTFVNILCAGNDLHRLILSNIYLADPHVVGVLVTNNGQNLTNNNIFDLSVHTLVGFNFLTEYGQFFHKFLIGNRGQIYKFFMEPFSVQFHYLYLLRIDSRI